MIFSVLVFILLSKNKIISIESKGSAFRYIRKIYSNVSQNSLSRNVNLPRSYSKVDDSLSIVATLLEFLFVFYCCFFTFALLCGATPNNAQCLVLHSIQETKIGQLNNPRSTACNSWPIVTSLQSFYNPQMRKFRITIYFYRKPHLMMMSSLIWPYH